MSGRPFIRASLRTRSLQCSEADFPDTGFFHDECPGYAPSGEACMCPCHPEPHVSEVA